MLLWIRFQNIFTRILFFIHSNFRLIFYLFVKIIKLKPLLYTILKFYQNGILSFLTKTTQFLNHVLRNLILDRLLQLSQGFPHLLVGITLEGRAPVFRSWFDRYTDYQRMKSNLFLIEVLS
jgi:hypothetical protein